MFAYLISDENYNDSFSSNRFKYCATLLSLVFVFGFTANAVLKESAHGQGLIETVGQAMHLSGVENPVTAVLLNFRAYDTLLELAVLLIAGIAVIPAFKTAQLPSKTIAPPNEDEVLGVLQRLLVPLTVVVSAYILWTGAYRPGGAFQAGALLAGVAILMMQTQRIAFSFGARSARCSLGLGLGVFIFTGAFSSLITGTVLQFPLLYAGPLILFIECAATLSIAASLVLLYQSIAKSGDDYA